MSTSYRPFLHTLRALGRGESLTRAMLHEAWKRVAITGAVVDVGGGRRPAYLRYLRHEGVTSITPVDASLSRIDFERDTLPFPDGSVDTAICANVLEHVYNYPFLLREIRRILAPAGHVIGFVPFWRGYHPDPQDYFRYTHEALERILHDAGFAEVSIEPLAVGPILANFNTLVLSFPRFVRPVFYIPYAFLDSLFVRLRPESLTRYPLGYIFKGNG